MDRPPWWHSTTVFFPFSNSSPLRILGPLFVKLIDWLVGWLVGALRKWEAATWCGCVRGELERETSGTFFRPRLLTTAGTGTRAG
jgi:hypothetical protein